jgi:gluconolactonase
MKSFSLFLFLSFLTVCISCNTPTKETSVKTKDTTIGKIELIDKDAANIIDTNATIEIVGSNYKWCEGPLWVASKQMLLFSDVRANTIFQWHMKDTPVVYLTPSGYTDTALRNGENGSNGLALDKLGRLLLCQSGNRQVVRMNAPLDSPKPSFTVLSANYKGKKFNSPNDLIADSKGNIYFTDPIYGLPKGAEDPTRELKFEGVYEIGVDGKTTLLIDSISNPNGIALSLDEKILYVGSTGNHSGWYAYHLNAKGNITDGGLFVDAAPLNEKAMIKQGGDGFKIDKFGNLVASGPDGINIISPQGKVLARIRIYDRPTSNCAFSETKDTLYFTADDLVLKVKLR